MKSILKYNLQYTYLLIVALLFISFKNSDIKNNTIMNKIEVGSQIPSFSLLNQHGDMVHIDSLIGKKNLVIYFYPKDDTPGCTKEACYFQDQFEVFKQANAEVIGINNNSVESHKKFADKYKLTFTLLSDKGSEVIKEFGVPTGMGGLIPGRVTYIADKTGKVVYIFNSKQATKHVDEAMRILKELE